MPDRPRVAVVGGGIIGISCAYALAYRGADVVVLERDAVGAGASSGNAGTIAAGHPPLNRPGRIAQAVRQMLDSTSPLYVKPRVDPGLWRWLFGFARYCTDDHVRHAMDVMGPLGHDALAAFGRILEEERIECAYSAVGYLEAASTDAGHEAGRHEAAVIGAHGYDAEVIDGEEARRREPSLGPGVIGAVHYHDSASLDPGLFLRRFAAAAVRRGVDLREGAEVRRIVRTSNRATGLELVDGARIDADAVVLATGPFGRRLLRPFGYVAPVQPGKGYHRDVDIGPNGAPQLRIPCVLAESSVFCTRMDTVVRFAGTMEFSGENTVMRPERLRQLTTAARASFPDMGTARPRSQWCGLRPMSMDGLPIVGPVPDTEGLFLATGHGMLGMTLGPVTGEMIAHQLLDGADARAEGLLPARFG